MAKKSAVKRKAIATKSVKATLKKQGLRLPHGYEIALRKKK